jgi:hypothetical protein
MAGLSCKPAGPTGKVKKSWNATLIGVDDGADAGLAWSAASTLPALDKTRTNNKRITAD